MASKGFLERLYLGDLDKSILQGLRNPKDLSRVQPVMDKYRELLKGYSPQEIEKEGEVPQDMLKKMGEIGLFGLSIPEPYGGLGFNLWEYLSTVEQMVKWDLSVGMVTLAHLSIGCKGIVLFGNEFQKLKYLVPAASGDMIFSYALTEPSIGSDAKHIETSAELSQDDGYYVLNGQKTYITNANYAGAMTVFAQMDPKRPGMMGAFIVETAWDGVKVGKDMPKMGLKASSTASVQFKDVKVPVENLIGEPGEGFKIAMTILNYGRLGLGAASVGMMEQSLADMKKRSSARIQFGMPIKNFPLIQEKMVKAKVHSFVSSAMNDFTSLLLDEDPLANVALETSHCKLFGTTRGWDVVYDALQVAGGAGYISTLPYEKRMRDFRVATVFEGTSEIHTIYPAQFLIRKVVGEIKLLNGNRISELSYLIGKIFKGTEWDLAYDEKVMQNASKLARSNVRIIRRMIKAGILLYGKSLAQREFLLRRITVLSLYTFAILATLSKLETRKRAGKLTREDLNLLDYFLQEVREARRKNNRILTSRREILHQRVFSDLF